MPLIFWTELYHLKASGFLDLGPTKAIFPILGKYHDGR